MMSSHCLLVDRQSINQCQLDSVAVPTIADGEILAKTGDFALTANNISYAFSGESIGYWQFFPADKPGQGLVPVWGYAEVIDSQNPDIAIGTRFWGFLPMAEHVVMRPKRLSNGSFIDIAEHRRKLPPIYNLYQTVSAQDDPLAGLEDVRSLTFPLFTTSWLIADYLSDNAMFGARQVIIGSASSKTGFGTAWNLQQLPNRPEQIIGLTSPRNIGFTQALGFYDTVIAYDAVTQLDPDIATVFVDMSGDGPLQTAIHGHFGDQLKASIGVGATHWSADRSKVPLAGAKPEFFFAPGQIEKRNADWGDGEPMRRAQRANITLARQLGGTLTIVHHTGPDAVRDQYQAMVDGRTPPDQGIICRF